MKTIPFVKLHPYSGEQIRSWFRHHLFVCPDCRYQIDHPDGHSDSNLLYMHFLKSNYLIQLAGLADVPKEVVVTVLDAIAMIPVSYSTFRRRCQEVHGKSERD
jgi:hypothetical protein